MANYLDKMRYVDKDYSLPETYLDSLTKSDKALAKKIALTLNAKTKKELYEKIENISKILKGESHSISTAMIFRILAKCNVKHIPDLSEQEALVHIAHDCGKLIMQRNYYPYSGDPFDPQNVRHIKTVIDHYKCEKTIAEYLAATLIYIENFMIHTIEDLKNNIELQRFSNDERFIIAQRLLAITYKCYKYDEVKENLGPFFPVQALELERMTILKGQIPSVEIFPDGRSEGLKLILQRIEALLPEEDFTEEDPLELADFTNERFLQRVSIPTKELYLLVGLVSDPVILRKISENLDSLLKKDCKYERYAVFQITYKIASEACRLINEGKMKWEEFIEMMKICLNRESLRAGESIPLSRYHDVLSLINELLSGKGKKFGFALDTVVSGLLELGMARHRVVNLIKKHCEKEHHEIIRLISNGLSLANFSNDEKLSLLNEILGKHSLATAKLILDEIENLGLGKKEKSELAKKIIDRIEHSYLHNFCTTNEGLELVTDEKTLTKIYSFVDKSDFVEVLKKTPKDYWINIIHFLIKADLNYINVLFDFSYPLDRIQNALQAILSRHSIDEILIPIIKENPRHRFREFKNIYHRNKEIAFAYVKVANLNAKVLSKIVKFFQDKDDMTIFLSFLIEREIDVDNEYCRKGPEAAAKMASYFGSFTEGEMNSFIELLQQVPPSYAQNKLLDLLAKQHSWKFVG